MPPKSTSTSVWLSFLVKLPRGRIDISTSWWWESSWNQERASIPTTTCTYPIKQGLTKSGKHPAGLDQIVEFRLVGADKSLNMKWKCPNPLAVQHLTPKSTTMSLSRTYLCPSVIASPCFFPNGFLSRNGRVMAKRPETSDLEKGRRDNYLKHPKCWKAYLISNHLQSKDRERERERENGDSYDDRGTLYIC